MKILTPDELERLIIAMLLLAFFYFLLRERKPTKDERKYQYFLDEINGSCSAAEMYGLEDSIQDWQAEHHGKRTANRINKWASELYEHMSHRSKILKNYSR